MSSKGTAQGGRSARRIDLSEGNRRRAMGHFTLPSRKPYLLHAFLVVTTTFCLVLGALFALYHVQLRRNALTLEADIARRELDEAQRNALLAEELARSVAQSIYASRDTQALLTASARDFSAGGLNHLHSLRALAADSAILHSVNVFNPYTNTVYSTRYGTADAAPSLFRIVARYPQLVRGQSAFRWDTDYLFSDEAPERVLSVYYPYQPTADSVPGGVLFNIEVPWLLERVFPRTDAASAARWAMRTAEGDLVGLDRHAEHLEEMQGILSDVAAGVPRGGTVERGGVRVRVDRVSPEDRPWGIIRYREHRRIFAALRPLSAVTVSGALSILVAVLGASMIVAAVLNRPIRRLTDDLRRRIGREPVSEGRTEFEEVRGAYGWMVNRLDRLEIEARMNVVSLKSYYVRSLLFHSAALTDQALAQIDSMERFTVDLKGPTAVAAVRIRVPNSPFGDFDRDLEMIKIKVMEEFASAVRGHGLTVEAAPMFRNRIGVLLGLDRSTLDYVTDLMPVIRAFQRCMHEEHHVDCVVSLSDTVSDPRDLAAVYASVRQNLRYRKTMGDLGIINPLNIRENLESSEPYPEKIEERLLEHIRSEKYQEAEETLDAFFERLRRMRFNDIAVALARLLFALETVAEELGRSRGIPIEVDYTDIYSTVFLSEPLDNTRRRIAETIPRFRGTHAEAVRSKSIIIAHTVNQIIRESLTDHGLCLKMIADALKLSPSYVGKVYKQITGESVANRINELRLQEARELMTRSDKSIADVASAVGIQNETYFYQLFKRRFGTTPREFILLHPTIGGADNRA